MINSEQESEYSSAYIEAEEDLFWTNCLIEAVESKEGCCVLTSEEGHQHTYSLDELAKMVSPVSRNEDGFTPLMAAARSGNKIAVIELLEHVKLSTEVKLMLTPDNSGANILHHAVMGGDFFTFNFLLNTVKERYSALTWETLQEEDHNGKTALDLAIYEKKSLNFIEFLLLEGGGFKNYEALMNSVVGNKEVADLLIRNGALLPLGVDGEELLDSATIVNLIVENLDKVAGAKDNGSCLLNIINRLQVTEIQNLFSKNSAIIAAVLLGEGDELVKNYNKRVGGENKITSIQNSKIGRIREFGLKVFSELKLQESEVVVLPAAATLIAVTDLLKDEVFVNDVRNYPEWRSSAYDHPEMTDVQKRIISKTIEEFFPAQAVSTSGEHSNLQSSASQETKGSCIIQ